MDIILSNLQNYFPSFLKIVLTKMYQARCERLRMLIHKGIPKDVHWIIEAKVRIAGEFSDSFV